MRRGIKIAVVGLLIVAIAGLGVIGCGPQGAEETGGGQVVQPDVVKVRYSTECSELSFTFASYYWPFQKEVEERSDGRIQITFYPNETLHKWPEFPEALQGGITDIACCIPSRRYDVFPLQLILAFPGIFKNEYETAIIFNKYLKAKYDDPYWDAIDSVNLSHNILEQSWFITMKKPLRTIEDLKGLEIPVSVIDSSYLTALGVVPVSGLYVDYYEMFQKGMLDGAKSMCDVISRMKWHTLATPGQGCVGPWPVVTNTDVPQAINKPFFQSLPKDLQEIILSAADKWLSSANMQGNRIVSGLSKKMFTDMGLVYTPWSEEDVKKFEDVAVEKGWPALFDQEAQYGPVEDLEEYIAEFQKYLDESQFDESMFKSLNGEYEVRDLTKGWEGVNNVLVDYKWFNAEDFVKP